MLTNGNAEDSLAEENFLTYAAKCYWSVDVILHNIRISVQGTANQNIVF